MKSFRQGKRRKKEKQKKKGRWIDGLLRLAIPTHLEGRPNKPGQKSGLDGVGIVL